MSFEIRNFFPKRKPFTSSYTRLYVYVVAGLVASPLPVRICSCFVFLSTFSMHSRLLLGKVTAKVMGKRVEVGLKMRQLLRTRGIQQPRGRWVIMATHKGVVAIASGNQATTVVSFIIWELCCTQVRLLRNPTLGPAQHQTL